MATAKKKLRNGKDVPVEPVRPRFTELNIGEGLTNLDGAELHAKHLGGNEVAIYRAKASDLTADALLVKGIPQSHRVQLLAGAEVKLSDVLTDTSVNGTLKLNGDGKPIYSIPISYPDDRVRDGEVKVEVRTPEAVVTSASTISVKGTHTIEVSKDVLAVDVIHRGNSTYELRAYEIPENPTDNKVGLGSTTINVPESGEATTSKVLDIGEAFAMSARATPYQPLEVKLTLGTPVDRGEFVVTSQLTGSEAAVTNTKVDKGATQTVEVLPGVSLGLVNVKDQPTKYELQSADGTKLWEFDLANKKFGNKTKNTLVSGGLSADGAEFTVTVAIQDGQPKLKFNVTKYTDCVERGLVNVITCGNIALSHNQLALTGTTAAQVPGYQFSIQRDDTNARKFLVSYQKDASTTIPIGEVEIPKGGLVTPQKCHEVKVNPGRYASVNVTAEPGKKPVFVINYRADFVESGDFELHVGPRSVRVQVPQGATSSKVDIGYGLTAQVERDATNPRKYTVSVGSMKNEIEVRALGPGEEQVVEDLNFDVLEIESGVGFPVRKAIFKAGQKPVLEFGFEVMQTRAQLEMGQLKIEGTTNPISVTDTPQLIYLKGKVGIRLSHKPGSLEYEVTGSYKGVPLGGSCKLNAEFGENNCVKIRLSRFRSVYVGIDARNTSGGDPPVVWVRQENTIRSRVAKWVSNTSQLLI